MPETKSRYSFPVSSVSVEPLPETKVIGYRPYVFWTFVSNRSEVVRGGSLDGGVRVVTTEPGAGAVVECS